ncbi:SRPBCC domain-containing protein [Agromyces marinus]|uniref:Activator of Hsp90 ATPase homologue 1/2-like C-terminal domain-containing protein n=1 Tax=Agromyces marinus TaxID=1389020 RepID=A0ABM8H1E3_9MICO|nr:SRPBCC domain-containing protein [Agromyces marinus]UIP57334.1 hypothetical protein DSM26151_01890 [Agromyces marinus]BDZ54564.1 hypothetical protein GCM10025870_16370 [Agromyces marinus]
MTITRATGHYVRKDDGLHLQFDRLFRSPIEEVWYTLTNPTAMQAWIGTYTGTPSTGAVRFRMSGEGAEWQNTSILECDAPYGFRADIGEGEASVRVFCHLREAGGMTTLTLGQLLHSAADATSVGPGWDYFLDRLVATRAGTELPDWQQYDPGLVETYRGLHVPDAASVADPAAGR